jgi:hypothetical protein
MLRRKDNDSHGNIADTILDAKLITPEDSVRGLAYLFHYLAHLRLHVFLLNQSAFVRPLDYLKF